MNKAAAALFLLGTAACSSFATEIHEDFAGTVNQAVGEKSGIFNVSENSIVRGTLTFNPQDFSPTPVVPSGNSYLDVFLGGADAVKLTLRDDGGATGVEAQSAFLEVSSSAASPWSLVVTGQDLSFSMVLQLEGSATLSPGLSAFDFSRFQPSTASILISDSAASLGFDMDSPLAAPEPDSMILCAGALVGLLVRFSRAKLTRFARRRAVRVYASETDC